MDTARSLESVETLAQSAELTPSNNERAQAVVSETLFHNPDGVRRLTWAEFYAATGQDTYRPKSLEILLRSNPPREELDWAYDVAPSRITVHPASEITQCANTLDKLDHQLLMTHFRMIKAAGYLHPNHHTEAQAILASPQSTKADRKDAASIMAQSKSPLIRMQGWLSKRELAGNPADVKLCDSAIDTTFLELLGNNLAGAPEAARLLGDRERADRVLEIANGRVEGHFG